MFGLIKEIVKDTLYGLAIMLTILLIFSCFAGIIFLMVAFPFISIPIVCLVVAWYIGSSERHIDDWRD